MGWAGLGFAYYTHKALGSKQTTIRIVTREEDKKVVRLPSVLIRLYHIENWRLRGVSTEASDSR